MRLCEFETSSKRRTCGLELFAWARYFRGDVPTQGERDYIERRVKDKYPNAELMALSRRFVPTVNGENPTEVWWEFRWIDFSNKKEGVSS